MYWKIAVGAILLVTIVAGLVVFRRVALDGWPFVERVTKLSLPPGTKRLAEYDNAEWFVVCVARIPPDLVGNFSREHGFVASGNTGFLSMSALGLPEPYRHLPSGDRVQMASGQTEYQSWEAILDRDSGLLWVHVSYPDPGGFNPGTGPNLPNKSLQPTATAVTPPAAQEIVPTVAVAEH
jgi:hypothetical protein